MANNHQSDDILIDDRLLCLIMIQIETPGKNYFVVKKPGPAPGKILSL